MSSPELMKLAAEFMEENEARLLELYQHETSKRILRLWQEVEICPAVFFSLGLTTGD